MPSQSTYTISTAEGSQPPHIASAWRQPMLKLQGRPNSPTLPPRDLGSLAVNMDMQALLAKFPSPPTRLTGRDQHCERTGTGRIKIPISKYTLPPQGPRRNRFDKLPAQDPDLPAPLGRKLDLNDPILARCYPEILHKQGCSWEEINKLRQKQNLGDWLFTSSPLGLLDSQSHPIKMGIHPPTQKGQKGQRTKPHQHKSPRLYPRDRDNEGHNASKAHLPLYMRHWIIGLCFVFVHLVYSVAHPAY